MLKKSEMMVQQLVNEKGHFYVCGDVSMAEDVCKTLKSILQQNGIADPDIALIKLRVTNCTQYFNPIPFQLVSLSSSSSSLFLVVLVLGYLYI